MTEKQEGRTGLVPLYNIQINLNMFSSIYFSDKVIIARYFTGKVNQILIIHIWQAVTAQLVDRPVFGWIGLFFNDLCHQMCLLLHFNTTPKPLMQCNSRIQYHIYVSHIKRLMEELINFLADFLNTWNFVWFAIDSWRP